ncbi:hypothetical protein BDQ12DRAFT_708824 [Crucibulum laeve]|uniref:Nephrocystin 3-like N-terminal domain-containing protein n=1 Tax=Crucibulum laeve TaxID=68775 RepID=A0A5C3MHZ1_9AGAR|nr:hypothetical protein BDQ12DRAFT_708824 [Crucibulum laeve]
MSKIKAVKFSESEPTLKSMNVQFYIDSATGLSEELKKCIQSSKSWGDTNIGAFVTIESPDLASNELRVTDSIKGTDTLSWLSSAKCKSLNSASTVTFYVKYEKRVINLQRKITVISKTDTYTLGDLILQQGGSGLDKSLDLPLYSDSKSSTSTHLKLSIREFGNAIAEAAIHAQQEAPFRIIDEEMNGVSAWLEEMSGSSSSSIQTLSNIGLAFYGVLDKVKMKHADPWKQIIYSNSGVEDEVQGVLRAINHMTNSIATGAIIQTIQAITAIQGYISDPEVVINTMPLEISRNPVNDLNTGLTAAYLKSCPTAAKQTNPEALDLILTTDSEQLKKENIAINLISKWIAFLPSWKNSPNIFWLQGSDAKSSPRNHIVSHMFDAYSKLGYGGIYYDFRQNGPNNLSALVPTIAYQISVTRAGATKYFEEAIVKSPGALDLDIHTKFKRFIVEPLCGMEKENTMHKPLLIILDNFDDCKFSGMEGIGDLLQIFSAEMGNLPTFVHILIASESSQLISDTFGKYDNILKYELRAPDIPKDTKERGSEYIPRGQDFTPANQHNPEANNFTHDIKKRDSYGWSNTMNAHEVILYAQKFRKIRKTPPTVQKITISLRGRPSLDTISEMNNANMKDDIQTGSVFEEDDFVF